MPVREIRPVLGGLGISILSTSQGILSDADARKKNIGGELICTVY
jgi:small subunit ribosomal protein S8